MATQVSDLRDRAEVWRAAAREQENGETVYEYAFQRTVWAAVTPTSGRAESLEGGATRAELTHRVVVREASLPDICREMCLPGPALWPDVTLCRSFPSRRGLRLDVSYWLPIYSRRGWMEIFCTAHEGEVTADGT